jgi:hypothetical protein
VVGREEVFECGDEAGGGGRAEEESNGGAVGWGREEVVELGEVYTYVETSKSTSHARWWISLTE